RHRVGNRVSTSRHPTAQALFLGGRRRRRRTIRDRCGDGTAAKRKRAANAALTVPGSGFAVRFDTIMQGEPKMRTMSVVSTTLVLSLVCATTLAATGPSPSVLYDRAKRAIAAGNVVPERDLAPLVNVLRSPPSEEDLRSAIDRIETLADASGSNPAAVKHYL